jgi:hypothetical protein
MVERLECAHCKKTGTCTNGENGVACAYCFGFNRKPATADRLKGIRCRVCDGIGTTEPFSLKLQNTFLPFFAMGFVFLLLGVIAFAYFFKTPNFEAILGFASTLIGSITAYYFGSKGVDPSLISKAVEPKNLEPRQRLPAAGGTVLPEQPTK